MASFEILWSTTWVNLPPPVGPSVTAMALEPLWET